MDDTLGTPLTIPEPDAPEAPGTPDTAPAKGGRPTTRAGRRAAAEAKRAAAKTAKPDTAPRKSTVTARDVAGSVQTLHEMAGTLALPMFGMPQTGAALAAAGPEAGKVWADVVKRYPQLERLFGAGTDGLVIFRLLMVYAPLISMAVSERAQPADPAAMAQNPLMAAMAMAGAMGGMPGMSPGTERYAGEPSGQSVPAGQNGGGRP